MGTFLTPKQYQYESQGFQQNDIEIIQQIYICIEIYLHNFYHKINTKTKNREMNSTSISPKLLMEFYKDEKVPMLVRKKPDTDQAYTPINNARHQEDQQSRKSFASSLLDNYFNKQQSTNNVNLNQNNMGFASRPNKLIESPPHPQNRYNSPISHQNQQQQSSRVFHTNNSPSIRDDRMRRTYEQKKYEEQIIIIQNLNKDNNQLKILTKQLTQKSIQLKTINNQLHQRIQELQTINDELNKQKQFEKSTNSSFENKIRNKVYEQLSFYVRDAITQFTNQLAKQKMSPIVENKIQGFLGLMLNLNDFTVKNNHHRNTNFKLNIKDVDQVIDQIIIHEKQSREQTKNRSNSASPISKYQTVFQKLNGNSSYKKSSPKNKVSRFDSSQIKSINEVSPGPSRLIKKQQGAKNHRQTSASRKRTKIFNKSYATQLNHRRQDQQKNEQPADRKLVRNLFTQNSRNLSSY